MIRNRYGYTVALIEIVPDVYLFDIGPNNNGDTCNYTRFGGADPRHPAFFDPEGGPMIAKGDTLGYFGLSKKEVKEIEVKEGGKIIIRTA